MTLMLYKAWIGYLDIMLQWIVIEKRLDSADQRRQRLCSMGYGRYYLKVL